MRSSLWCYIWRHGIIFDVQWPHFEWPCRRVGLLHFAKSVFNKQAAVMFFVSHLRSLRYFCSFSKNTLWLPRVRRNESCATRCNVSSSPAAALGNLICGRSADLMCKGLLVSQLYFLKDKWTLQVPDMYTFCFCSGVNVSPINKNQMTKGSWLKGWLANVELASFWFLIDNLPSRESLQERLRLISVFIVPVFVRYCNDVFPHCSVCVVDYIFFSCFT